MNVELIRKITSVFAAIIVFFAGLFNLSSKPMGPPLDLDGYELVYEDEFDGDSLDLDAWFYRGAGLRRGNYNASSQVNVADGLLTITAQYREDGEFGPGWYSGMLALHQRYCRGYFEIKCKCAPGGGFWSAFWFPGDGAYEHDISRGGVGAAEIDIMEAMYYNELTSAKRNSIISTIHCNGGDDDPDHIDSKRLGKFQGNDIYNTFNTYGLKWTEDEYIFYINGTETVRSSFSKGVSTAMEELIVSLEIPETIDHTEDFTTEMVVDYVRIYQIP